MRIVLGIVFGVTAAGLMLSLVVSPESLRQAADELERLQQRCRNAADIYNEAMAEKRGRRVKKTA
jgi:hypothetical protein